MYARCVLRSRVDMLNLVIEPVSKAFGSDWKGHKVAGARPTSKNHRRFASGQVKDPAAREAALLHAFGRAGARVRAVPAGEPTSG